MDAVQRVMKNSAVLVAEKIALSGLSIFVVSYVARSLGEVDYGKFAFAFGFVELFRILGDMGLWTLTVREVAKDRSIASAFLGHSLMIHSLLIVLTFLSIAVAVNLMGYSSDTRVLVYIAAFALVFELMADCFRAIFQAFQKMEYSALLRIIYGVFAGGFAISVLYLGRGVLMVSSGYLMGNILIIGIAYWFVVKHFARPTFQIDFRVWKKMLRRSLPFAFQAFFILIAFKFDIVMLSKMKGDAEVGWYNVAANLTYKMLFIAVALSGSIYPAVSELLGTSIEKASKLVTRSLYFLLVLGLPLAVGGTLLGPQIILFLFGERYLPSILVFQVIVWFVPLCYTATLLSNVLVAMELQRLVVRTGAVKAGINIGLNAFLIPTFGAIGAAIATVVSEGFVALYYIPTVSKHFSFRRLRRKFTALAISNACMAGFLLIPQVHQLHFSLEIAGGMVIYFGFMLLFRGLDKQDIIAVRNLLPYGGIYRRKVVFWS
ncbi:hypothetical protein AMJ40_05900 [candidate division TA06 bacterium DG_26]|uniref:Uncharacterized protein n=1 Tax=candidate division TA06 bacterium DG_26 TaxID=1703771 RepID=A0A0S7WGK1_UNCT6|nr:MAG: hypothetical protein AMJ40_05900 [candidate division TA06 bacterium DG_26]